MDLQTFTEKFAGIFDEVAPEDITLETNFQELEEWSSLTILSIIAFVKAACNKEVTGKEIRGCSSVKELFELVSSK